MVKTAPVGAAEMESSEGRQFAFCTNSLGGVECPLIEAGYDYIGDRVSQGLIARYDREMVHRMRDGDTNRSSGLAPERVAREVWLGLVEDLKWTQMGDLAEAVADDLGWLPEGEEA